MSKLSSTVRYGSRWSALMCVLSVGLVAGACSDGSRNMTGPSAVGGTQAKPGPTTQASGPGTTLVSFENFDASTLMVTVKTVTSSLVGQPYIDQGKIHLQILTDELGNPVPCGTVGGIWTRFDGDGGGIDITTAMTSSATDLGALGAACGDSICIRAQYVTGGGQTHVDTHFSDPTPFNVVCPGGCTYTQGFWKNHGPNPSGNNQNEWPVTSLTLGSVSYSDLELESILNTPVGGNGLISLAHQLIAAKLNVANGASAPTERD